MSNKKRLPVRVAKARYREPTNPAYAGNPLILALPPCVEPIRMKKLLTVTVPSFEFEDLSLSEREGRIKELRNLRIMSTQYLDFYQSVYNLIESGYVQRNPLKVDVIAWSYDIADPSVSLDELEQPGLIDGLKETTSGAMFLTGFSGNGKSTISEHILFNLMPQVLEHNYENFNELQIVYLKVDFPHDAKRPELIYRIAEELDWVLSKTSYGDPLYRKTMLNNKGEYKAINRMLELLMTQLNRHHVGLLVVDEFQTLLISSLRYRQEVIQMFDDISNSLYTPLLKIGTPDALGLFEKNSRHKRRQGEVFELKPFTDEHTRERILKALYEFQPLRKIIQRTKEIDELLFNLSGGVPDYLIGLWQAVLVEAIRSGKERISKQLIMQVFRKRYPLLRYAIQCINTGKKGPFADLITVQQYFDNERVDSALKYLHQSVQKMDVTGKAAEDIEKDILDSLEGMVLKPAQYKKLEKIKESLANKKSGLSGPQTLEHK